VSLSLREFQIEALASSELAAEQHCRRQVCALPTGTSKPQIIAVLQGGHPRSRRTWGEPNRPDWERGR